VEQLASLLRIPPQTVEHWFEGGMAPPVWLVAMMMLLEAPKSSSCPPGCGSDFDSLGREEALRRVRAI
jgi:hypothetical protein